MEWREGGDVRWLEARLPDATAVFTTRIGGVSDSPFDRLNLGVFTDDEGAVVARNRQLLAAALGFAPERIVIGRQVHGAELATHGGPQEPSPFAAPGSSIPKVDGHVTTEASLPLLVFVADCVPVALSGPKGVAMLHCGWRGLAAGLIEKGVAAVAANTAAVGPCIGPCCYEVGADVRAAFDGLGAVADGNRLDLPAVACQQLRSVGVAQIEVSGLCTSCEHEFFFSHRRDAGRTGRQAGLIWRDAEAG